MAGFTPRDLAEAEKIEQAQDTLGIEQTYDGTPTTHTKKPKKDAPREKRLDTPIMIGDAINATSYELYKVMSGSDPDTDKLFRAMVTRLGQEGSLAKDEIDEFIQIAKEGQNEISNTARKGEQWAKKIYLLDN